MARPKILSDADLQVSLLKRIAGYKRKRIPVADLLRAFIKDVPGTGDEAAIKVHKVLSVGCGAPVHDRWSPARGQVTQEVLPGTDLDALLGEATPRPRWPGH